MQTELKTQNSALLKMVYGGTFFLVALVQWGVEEAFALTIRLAGQVGVLAIISVFGAMLSDSLPDSAKDRLVFFRFRNALPGHRCRRLCEKDPRLSIERLEKRWPELFVQGMEESAQNAYWYDEIYKPVTNAPEVLQAHRKFLLYRDAASGLFILLIALLVWRVVAGFASLPSLGSWPLLILAGVVLLLCLAGMQRGKEMVRNAAVEGLRMAQQ